MVDKFVHPELLSVWEDISLHRFFVFSICCRCTHTRCPPSPLLTVTHNTQHTIHGANTHQSGYVLCVCVQRHALLSLGGRTLRKNHPHSRHAMKEDNNVGKNDRPDMFGPDGPGGQFLLLQTTTTAVKKWIHSSANLDPRHSVVLLWMTLYLLNINSCPPSQNSWSSSSAPR